MSNFFKQSKFRKKSIPSFSHLFGWLAPLLTLLLCSSKYGCPSYEIESRKALDRLSQKLCKQYELTFLASGKGQKLVDFHGSVWSLNLMSSKKLTLDQARALATQIANALIYEMTHNPSFAYARKMLAKQYPNEPVEVKPEMMSYQLAFWDDNMDRPLYPYVAQIQFFDHKLVYRYADPKTQALLDPTIEPFFCEKHHE